MDRFGVKTRYHVWTVVDRRNAGKSTEAIQHFGARGVGDAVARERAYDFAAGLNAGYTFRPVPSSASEHYLSGYRTGENIAGAEGKLVVV